MYPKELSERSPLRLFEQSTHGGLGPGNIGVAVGRAGVGKTAFLVGVALDGLLRGLPVLHAALEQSVEKVRVYYDEIFRDLADGCRLEDADSVRLDLERRRHIHTWVGHSFSIPRLREAVVFLREHAHFEPRVILIDDLDFASATSAEIEDLRLLARQLEAEMWMSAVTHRDARRNSRGVPEPVARLEEGLSVIIAMAHDGRAVRIRLLKDHDNPEVSDLSLALNPTTMLLMPE